MELEQYADKLMDFADALHEEANDLHASSILKMELHTVADSLIDVVIDLNHVDYKIRDEGGTLK